MLAYLFADGGSRGNPGPSAAGFVILENSDGNRGKIITKGGAFLGVTTNNQAEYHALKNGIAEAKRIGVNEIHIRMDSLLVVNQIKGIFKVKNRDLWPIYMAIKEELEYFTKYEISHVRREFNQLADAMANKILDISETEGQFDNSLIATIEL